MKTTIIIVVIIILGVGGYMYAVRAPAAPSMDVKDAADTTTPTGTMTPQTTGTTYKISSTGSKVEFKINEVLRDKPFMAVGVTSEIAGDVVVSSSSVSFGTIAINARTFKTDAPNRDGAIARFILKSEDAANEFIYFKATSVTSTSVSGDLTIAGVTKPANFAITMIQSGDVLSGTATANLKRSDFGLTIPSVPFVASVEDSFVVTATIVANKVK